MTYAEFNIKNTTTTIFTVCMGHAMTTVFTVCMGHAIEVNTNLTDYQRVTIAVAPYVMWLWVSLSCITPFSISVRRLLITYAIWVAYSEDQEQPLQLSPLRSLRLLFFVCLCVCLSYIS